MVEILPHLNASLNATAGALLLTGWFFIRGAHKTPHRVCMTAAFACSVLFLISYLTRYALTGNQIYAGPGRSFYLALLASHVILAAFVPFLAIRTLYLATRERFDAHRAWARVTFPIWMYVSITGVGVYWMLYR